MNNNDNQLYTEREAASLLNISRGTLSNWRSENRGPAYCKIGGAIRYPAGKLNEFVDNSLVVVG